MVYKKKKLMKQQYIWEKFLKPPLGKIMLLKEHSGKNSWSCHCLKQTIGGKKKKEKFRVLSLRKKKKIERQ